MIEFQEALLGYRGGHDDWTALADAAGTPYQLSMAYTEVLMRGDAEALPSLHSKILPLETTSVRDFSRIYLGAHLHDQDFLPDLRPKMLEEAVRHEEELDLYFDANDFNDQELLTGARKAMLENYGREGLFEVYHFVVLKDDPGFREEILEAVIAQSTSRADFIEAYVVAHTQNDRLFLGKLYEGIPSRDWNLQELLDFHVAATVKRDDEFRQLICGIISVVASELEQREKVRQHAQFYKDEELADVFAPNSS